MDHKYLCIFVFHELKEIPIHGVNTKPYTYVENQNLKSENQSLKSGDTVKI